MVELSSGFKSGTVKFVGETEFQPGEWIGVALDRPIGVRRGYYSPLGYFTLWYQNHCIICVQILQLQTSSVVLIT